MSTIMGAQSVAKQILEKNKAKAEPEAKEKRDKRVQIVLTQSLYDELIETRFKRKNKSVNETIIQAITEYIERSK